MGDGNAGAQLLKIIVKIALFIVKLIPGLVRLIIKGVKSIIAMIQGNKSEVNVQKPEELEQKTKQN